MKYRANKLNSKLIELGKPLGLDEASSIKAKRNIKNILAMAIVAGIIMLLGSLVMPGGPCGKFYGGGSIRDFKILLGGWLY